MPQLISDSDKSGITQHKNFALNKHGIVSVCNDFLPPLK